MQKPVQFGHPELQMGFRGGIQHGSTLLGDIHHPVRTLPSMRDCRSSTGLFTTFSKSPEEVVALFAPRALSSTSRQLVQG